MGGTGVDTQRSSPTVEEVQSVFEFVRPFVEQKLQSQVWGGDIFDDWRDDLVGDFFDCMGDEDEAPDYIDRCYDAVDRAVACAVIECATRYLAVIGYPKEEHAVQQSPDV